MGGSEQSQSRDLSSSASNPHHNNAPSHAGLSAPAVGSVPYVSGAHTDNGTVQAGASTVVAAVANAGPAQIARSGGIGLSTTMAPNQLAALKEKLQHSSEKPSSGPPAAPLHVSTSPIQRPSSNGTTSQSRQVAQAAAQNGQSWRVPNPLLLPGKSSRPSVASNQAPQRTAPRPAPVPTQLPKTSHLATSQASIAAKHAASAPRGPGRPLVVQPAVPQLQRQQIRAQPGVSVTVPQSKLPQQVKKPKVVLSPEAKQALANAIWSAIRSPHGTISPELMQAALATGLPKNAILNAARVAREREAMKRKAMQQQKRQQNFQPQRPGPASSVHRPVKPVSTLPYNPQAMKHTASNRFPMAGKTVPNGGPSKAMATFSKPKPSPSIHQMQTVKLLQLRAAERAKWKRVHHGIFLVQKGKFLSPPHTLCGIVRSQSAVAVLRSSQVRPSRKRIRSDVLAEAARLQRALRAKPKLVEPLLDPEKFKRIKIEPKKFAKALDRVVRKARQTAAESLNKQYKEWSKALVSHQQEFFKFHKQRKVDALRLAKLIRDNADKESKKKEKDAVAAEKARLAALKANDMDAYSKLLEETKNERLKFLMDKTEKHFSQISTSLLQERNRDGSVASTGGTASYYASAHLKTEEVRQPGILVGGDLKEYQMSGLQWLVSLYNNKLNGILADEMGLGKTIQAISLVAYLMEFKSNLGPYLVIVPLSTLSNWVNEFQKWCPSAHVICYKGTPGQRKELYKDQVMNGHFNVLLTTYEYIIKDKASLRKITWQYAIVDEGHRMKNAASKFAKTLSSQYITKYRLLLTGTPLMNDLSELWSLLNFLLPSIFNSVDTFDQWFNKPFAQFGNSSNEDETNFLSNEERMFIIHRLHELLRPFMLRRVKSEVLDQLPEKVEKILRCELSSWQKELYKQISKKAAIENDIAGTGFVQPQPASRGLNNVVMQLRKVCNHPYLFSPEGYHVNENIFRSSGKIELLDRMLPKLRAAGHRVLMFTQMTAVMTILEDYFAFRGYLSLRLDGSTPAEEREKRMYKFNAPDSPYFIFLLSTRAGGLGLNLTAANTVIIFDSDWNPMMDLQAQDRAHRIGQRSDVSVFRLVTYSPVEEKILSRATEKLNMSELVVEAGKFDKRSVENDNSLERKKMMEVLLTDFDTTTSKITDDKATSERTGSDVADEDDDGDDDEGSEGTKEEGLNELISNNEGDYHLYEALDRERENDPSYVNMGLYTSEDDVPDWIKYPVSRKATSYQNSSIADSGPRKRKEVMYDDGLTEKQFLRMMEKQFDGEEAAREQAKASRRAASTTSASSVASSAAVSAESDLTDWTFRKLISCTKAVVALKDPSTKRRLCEVFLEKPSPEQFPDYYEMIEKPIAINDILRKCRAKLYSSLQEFRDDWKVMFANAKTFNGEESWVVADGKALDKELDRVLKKNGFNEETPKVKSPPPKKKKLRIKLSLKTLKAKATQQKQEVPEQPTEPEPVAEISDRRTPKKKRKVK